jgi:ribosome-associated protein
MEDIVKIKHEVIEIARLLDEHKAEDTVVLDLKELCSFSDFFIITTVRSQAHLRGLLMNLNDYLNKHNIESLNSSKNRTAADTQSWLLIDCGSFIIHLMEKEAREFYELEKLWFKSEVLYQSSKLS